METGLRGSAAVMAMVAIALAFQVVAAASPEDHSRGLCKEDGQQRGSLSTDCASREVPVQYKHGEADIFTTLVPESRRVDVVVSFLVDVSWTTVSQLMVLGIFVLLGITIMFRQKEAARVAEHEREEAARAAAHARQEQGNDAMVKRILDGSLAVFKFISFF